MIWELKIILIVTRKKKTAFFPKKEYLDKVYDSILAWQAIDPVIKKQVVNQWLSGDSRDRIAVNNGVGTGTVSNIMVLVS
jgi:hypothetical protein